MQNYLAHHGIKDQKWYVRRFQNEDGSLTPAGKKRYGEWNPGKRKKTTLKEVRNKDGSYRYNIESEDGSKVGNISTYHQSDDSLRVSWISVDKNHKREGYASGAMDTLFNQAKEKGYKKVTVVIPKDDTNVQHIYERLGFKPSNDGLTNDEVADSITSLGEVVKMEYELEHSDTLDDVLDDFLSHSAKGTTWKDHKYIKKENGRYYYPEEHSSSSYEIKTDVWDDKELDKIAKEMQDKVNIARRNMQNTDDPEEKARYRAEMEEAQVAYDEWKSKEEKKPKHWLKSPYSTITTSGSITYSEDLLDNFLAHYGVGPDDDPPGRGSGRYAKGTGENPYQHDDAKRAQMKKRGLFGSIQTALAKRKADTDAKTLVEQSEKELLSKYKSWHKVASKSGSEDSPEAQKAHKAYEDAVTNAVKRLKPNAEDYEIHDVSAAMKKLVADSFEKNRLEEHNRRVENLNKARETKAANKAKAEEEKKTKEERDAAKAKAIASGDPEQISKWLTEMSNQEQFDALNRIRQTKDIKSQAAAQVKAREDAAKAEEARRKAEEEANRPKTKKELRDEKLEAGFEKAKDVMNKVDDVRQMAEKGIKFWNVVAAVNNATNPDFKLPKVDLNSGEKKKDKDKEENKENKENKNQNKNQQNNTGSTTNTNSNNTTYNTTNNYYNGEKKEETKSETETEAETWRPSGMEDWYDAPYKYEEAGKLLLEDFMKRKK